MAWERKRLYLIRDTGLNKVCVGNQEMSKHGKLKKYV